MNRYRIVVTSIEEVTSLTTLEVVAESEKQARELCEKARGSWRNNESTKSVQIVVPEAVHDADLVSLGYRVEKVTPVPVKVKAVSTTIPTTIQTDVFDE